jgi:flotillin
MNDVINTGFSLGLGGMIGIGLGLFALVYIIIAKAFRVVVEPNEVHVVQNRNSTVMYGKAPEPVLDSDGNEVQSEGNVTVSNSYYAWPTWWPRIGVTVRVLSLAIFDKDLADYEAYDIGKVPFMVDVVAFFRIFDPAIAAKRTVDQEDLEKQLKAILQGATRNILAKNEIEEIMQERNTYGQLFTEETEDQLRAWGVCNVKNIELMDIRDGRDSRVVTDIMAKKESLIDRESRVVRADNMKKAETAEIEARQTVEVREQMAQQLVGERTAEKDKAVGIANEKAKQEIKTQAKETATRDMAVQQVEHVRAAEINRDVQVVAADQDRQTFVIRADGEKQQKVIAAEAQKEQTIIVAEGDLQDSLKEAEGILAIGQSNAEAKRLAEMALVDPQIVLATEIGENEGYQSYLIKIRGVEKDEVVGVEQAKALQDAGIKVIANTGNVNSGVDSVMDLFSSKGGTEIAAMAEALNQTDAGAALLSRLGINATPEKAAATATPRKTASKKS